MADKEENVNPQHYIHLRPDEIPKDVWAKIMSNLAEPDDFEEEIDELSRGPTHEKEKRLLNKHFKNKNKKKSGGKVYTSHDKRYSHGGKVSGRKATYKY
jgi:hypothetical protein